jgi:hypothetical protein
VVGSSTLIDASRPGAWIAWSAAQALTGHVLTCVAHDYPRMDLMPWRVAPLGVVIVSVELEAPPVRRVIAPDPRGPGRVDLTGHRPAGPGRGRWSRPDRRGGSPSR